MSWLCRHVQYYLFLPKRAIEDPLGKALTLPECVDLLCCKRAAVDTVSEIDGSCPRSRHLDRESLNWLVATTWSRSSLTTTPYIHTPLHYGVCRAKYSIQHRNGKGNYYDGMTSRQCSGHFAHHASCRMWHTHGGHLATMALFTAYFCRKSCNSVRFFCSISP